MPNISNMATTQQLEELYTKITDETIARFDAGVKSLEAMETEVVWKNTEMIQSMAGIRTEMSAMEQRLRQESGLEMDRRIGIALAARSDKGGGTPNLISDPRNKGIEHFAGCKAEEVRDFRIWRAKVYNYLERFMPGSEEMFTKYVFTDEPFDEITTGLTGTWDERYTDEVVRREMKIFLTEHLDSGAAEVIRGEHPKAWKRTSGNGSQLQFVDAFPATAADSWRQLLTA